jgi:hypothetical protein
MKIKTNFLIYGPKIAFMRHWNVAGALVSPKGITLNWKWPWWVLKAILASSAGSILI